jgi:hypothetical protein
MKTTWITILTSFAFSAIGLITAVCIAVYAPTPPTNRPDFERTMFILLPFSGAAVGWLIAYLATPLDSPDRRK